MSLTKRRISRRALGVVVGASLLTLGLQVPASAAPAVSAISPTSGPEGCVVVITGTGFDQAGALAIDEVAFTDTVIGDTPAEFHVVSDTEIWTTVPTGAATGSIVVTDGNGDSSNSPVFTATDLAADPEGSCGPTIASFTPTCGTVGTVVTITGTNLLSESGDDLPAPADDPVGGEVKFNPYGATAGTGLASHTGAAESPTTLVVNVPSGAVDGPIRVTTALVPAAADDSVDSTTAFNVVLNATECGVGTHPRSISLSLRRHLVARGTVTSTDDPAVAECFAGVPVKIQRRQSGSWKTVGSTTTNDEGKYKRRIKDRPGKYRALAPAVTLADDSVCAKAKSPRVRHRH